MRVPDFGQQEVTRRCQQGETIQLARLPGASHDAREDGAGYLMGWVLDRFEGREAPESCSMQSERLKAGEGI